MKEAITGVSRRGMTTVEQTAVLQERAPRGGVYCAFIRNAFLMMLAYRLRYFTGILTYLLFVSVHYFIWQAVFAGHAPGTRINGFTMPEMVTYVAIGWIARSLYFSSIDSDIDELVRTGQISVYLLRPVHFHTMMFCQAAGESLFRLAFFTFPIAIVILLAFPVALPAGALNGCFFLLSSVFSFLISTEINFLVGMLAFSLQSIEGVIRAKYFLVQLLSGLLLPLTFFPAWLQPVLDALPFKVIAFVPLQFYLGKIPATHAWTVFLNQFVWFAVLVIAGQLMWSKAVKKLTLQGG